MFYRKIIDLLNKWSKEQDRKPLILRGARQVGKTTAVHMFSKSFDQYIYLNLETHRDREIFLHKLSIDDLVQAIFLHANISDTKGKILIFIDEIQHSPEAVAIMRYFYETKKHLYVIGAGSLLETMIGNNQISFPVGRVQYLFMYPLTFEEFLIAMKEKQALKFYNTLPLPSFAHDKLLKLFHTYTLIGGMPEIVKNYASHLDMVQLKQIYQSLQTSFIDDVSKYARNHTMIETITHAIESSPFEAGKRIKFQCFGNSNYRSREMGEALRMIERAMLIFLLYPSTATQIPIMPDTKKSPRLQFIDTGFLNYIVGLQGHYYQHSDLHSFYQGTIAEHIVGQELMASDMTSSKKLSFWVRDKKQSVAEVDFLISYQQYIIPIEVKAGKTGTLRSLHQFLDASNNTFAVRLYAGDINISDATTLSGKKYRLLNLPYFLTGNIEQYVDLYL